MTEKMLPPPASSTLADICSKVEEELAVAVPPGTPLHYECFSRLITVGVLRALIEIENRGGLALCLGRMAAERGRAGCPLDAPLGEPAHDDH